MQITMSERELLAGTPAWRRIHPEKKAARLTKLRELRCANVTMGEPDIPYITTAYGDVLMDAIEQADWCELLRQCATEMDREEIVYWLAQKNCAKMKERIFGMFNDGCAAIYCLYSPGYILTMEDAGRSAVVRSEFRVYPADHTTDHLSDDISVHLREYDSADCMSILSVLCTEWVQGRRKSPAARDFICSVCEKTESRE